MGKIATFGSTHSYLISLQLNPQDINTFKAALSSNMARSSISDSSIEEQKSFLPYKNSEECLACQHCSNRTKSSIGLLSRLLPWILNFCLTLTLISVIAFPTPHRFNSSEHPERLDVLCKTSQAFKSHLLTLPQAPAKDAVEHVLYKFDSGFDPHISPYQGFPSEEKDKLWSELYACKFLHCTFVAALGLSCCRWHDASH